MDLSLVAPKLSQGNIFDAILEGRAELAVVFGHIGFNEMGVTWKAFCRISGKWEGVDPFMSLSGTPQQYNERQWVTFVKNHGMKDVDVLTELDKALMWCQRNNVQSIITNGIGDVVHGLVTSKNRSSDEVRARLLISYATKEQQRRNVKFELMSLNDVFIHL